MNSGVTRSASVTLWLHRLELRFTWLRRIAASFVAVLLVYEAVSGPVSAAIPNIVISVSPATIASAPSFKPGLADLHRFLGRLTGGQITDSLDPRLSDLSLYLASAPDAPQAAVRRLVDKGLTPFVISGNGHKVQITANDPQGLVNGVGFYLEQLGVRWLLPNPNWTVVPHRLDVSLRIDRLVEPAFKVRSYAGTGGFYSWKWGRNFAGSASLERDTTDWKRRLRYGGEYTLGTAVGEAFIADRAISPILNSASGLPGGDRWPPLSPLHPRCDGQKGAQCHRQGECGLTGGCERFLQLGPFAVPGRARKP